MVSIVARKERPIPSCNRVGSTFSRELRSRPDDRTCEPTQTDESGDARRCGGLRMDAMVIGTEAGAGDLLRVLGFAGSLRARSYNGALLRSAQELAPAGMAIEIYESIELPLFNEDIEAQGDPEPVAAFKTAIREADALLVATPEYNYGVP